MEINGVEIKDTYAEGFGIKVTRILVTAATEELAKIAPFYNFSGINQITEDDRNYVDYTHYNAQVGDLIIDTIFDKKRYDSLYENGFGWYVDENNIVDLLSVLNQQYVTRLNR